MADRNFDDLVERFESRIYGGLKGQIREQILWEHMNELIPIDETEKLLALDVGGGLGQMTGRMLQAGHQVVLNDLSQKMLTRAIEKLSAQDDLALNSLKTLHGPILQFVYEYEQKVDVVICHAVLEWLDQPLDMLRDLVKVLKPGGYLSLAFYNRHALVLKNAKEGNLHYLLPQQGLRKPKRKGLSPPNSQYPEEVFSHCNSIGLEKLGHCGVRVLTDWIDEEKKSSFEQMLEIERYYSKRKPFDMMGRYVHVVFQKNLGLSG